MLNQRYRPLSKVMLAVFLSIAMLQSSQAAEKARAPIDLSTAIIQVAKQTIPAVVHIEVTERQEVSDPLAPFESDPFLRRFFDIPKTPRKFKRELKGLGTGMIIDEQGHILTNHHVAGGATKIEVLLADGRRYPAKLVGTDPKTDLAVIRIAAKGSLPHVTFGDSDKVEVGQWVVAIGHPRGLDQTVTQGIVSAKHRQGITDPGSFEDFLQTDAAINPGNSGGPLLNLYGEVIGVNAAIASQSGGSEGIGFTIPSNMAQYVAKELIAHGKVERGWLGVSIQDLTQKAAEAAHREGLKGALIAEVSKGGPADKAGMKKDDIIIAFGDKEITDAGTLRNDVAATPIGRDVKVTILRKGNKQELTVKIGNLRDAVKILVASLKDRLGAEFKPVTAKQAEKYGFDAGQGLAITWVDSAGPLGESGFEVGDIILEINGQNIESIDALAELIGQLRPKEQVTLLALDYRTGNVGYLQVTVR
jgi:serine protease Do